MKTQAWGWLVAAVMAAGLNASYHDGGLQWAHQIAEQAGHSTSAVIALATGHADQFLAEAQMVTARSKSQACPLSAALAEVQSVRVLAFSSFEQFEAMSAREEAQLARLEANRARMEARLAQLRIPAMAVNPVVMPSPRISICPRLRMNIPQPPVVRSPRLPEVHIDVPGAGPV